MSHIDSFKHELVGLLGGLPVYHPLEKIEGDFICDHHQLVIGGGSGEHPAVVIEKPLSAVANFLRKVIVEHEELEHWKKIIAPHYNYDYSELLTFYDWNIALYSSFYEMSTSESLPNPSDGGSIEDWLITGVGEFIFYAMPSLASEIMDQLERPYQYFDYMRFNNIMIIPPNFPVYANGGNHFFKKTQ